MTTKILIAEEQRLFRDALKCVLEAHKGLEVVATVSEGPEATRLCIELQPDVAILELALPGLPGPSAIGKIRSATKRTRCIAISSQESCSHVQQALRAGASGYVTKHAPASDLIEAVHCVRAGRLFLSPSVSGQLVEAVALGRAAPSSRLELLSSREREVLQLIAEGLTSKEIAHQLVVSPKTANTHRASLMEKLGIHKAPSLVRFAIREGLVAP